MVGGREWSVSAHQLQPPPQELERAARTPSWGALQAVTALALRVKACLGVRQAAHHRTAPHMGGRRHEGGIQHCIPLHLIAAVMPPGSASTSKEEAQRQGAPQQGVTARVAHSEPMLGDFFSPM